MKKLLSLLIVFMISFTLLTPRVKAFSDSRWVEDESGYFNFINPQSSYTVTRNDFEDYNFEYKVTNGNWKILNLANNDTLNYIANLGQSYLAWELLINDSELISGVSGSYGNQESISLSMRFKVKETQEPEQPVDPEEPSEPEELEAIDNRWSQSLHGYFNFVNNGKNYTLTDILFTDYRFEFKVNDSSWQVLQLNDSDTLSYQVQSGNSYISWELLINSVEIMSGVSGMYGQNNSSLSMRYKAVDNSGPVDPENPDRPVWESINGFMYYDNKINPNSDRLVDISNVGFKIVEYRIIDTMNSYQGDWKIINTSNTSVVVLRNRAENYYSGTSLLVIDGAIERQLATATLSRTTNEKIQIRYKEIDSSTLTPVNNLPDTRGSIFDEVAEVGSVKFLVDNHTVTTVISYDNINYYTQNTFEPNTDMSLFNHTKEVFYYTKDNQKFVVINDGNESMFSSKDLRKQKFIPYTIWNLNTNEIENVDRFNTYLYTKKEAGNNVYAYFYVDDFIIDNLVSVSLSYKFRYVKTFGGYSEYEQRFMTLEEDEVSSAELLTWQAKVMTSTAAAVGIGAMIPVARWPIALVGTAVVLYVGNTIDHSYFSYGSIKQIQEATVNNELRQEINNGIKKHDSSIQLDPSKKVFKLHLGQFNKTLTNGIDFDENYSVVDGQKGINIMQFTYRTDGQLYEVDGKNINVNLETGSGTDGEQPDPIFNLWAWIKKMFNQHPAAAWTVTVVVFLIVGLPILTRVKRNWKAFWK